MFSLILTLFWNNHTLSEIYIIQLQSENLVSARARMHKGFRHDIVKFGTIGDWLRKNESEIKKS